MSKKKKEIVPETDPAKAAEKGATAAELLWEVASELGLYPSDIPKLFECSTNLTHQLCIKKGLTKADITHANCIRASELENEQKRHHWEQWEEFNRMPNRRLNIVVMGHPKLDPELNPQHPDNRNPNIGASSTTQSLGSPERGHSPASNSVSTVSKPGKRYEMYGYPVTAVIRWMGKDAWVKDDVKKVMKHFGIDCADNTISCQLVAGRKGERGEPANLSEKQVEELYSIIEG